MPLTYEEEDAIRKRRDEMRTKSLEEAESIFRLAGIAFRERWELPNGYWPDSPAYDSVRRPWWLFWTQWGPIRIGWRKSVLSINWTSTSVRCLATEDDVTKDPDMVHAYSVAKAVEYLTKWREMAEASSVLKEDTAASEAEPLI